MKTGYYFLYRLIGVLVNMYAYIALFCFVMILFYGGPSWITVPVFLSACVVIYSTLSGRFGTLVIMLKKPIRHSIKEWITVNAYISIAIYAIMLLSAASAIANPGQVLETQKQVAAKLSQGGAVFTRTQIMAFAELMAVISLLIVVHCIWTLRLVRRFRDFFQ